MYPFIHSMYGTEKCRGKVRKFHLGGSSAGGRGRGVRGDSLMTRLRKVPNAVDAMKVSWRRQSRRKRKGPTIEELRKWINIVKLIFQTEIIILSSIYNYITERSAEFQRKTALCYIIAHILISYTSSPRSRTKISILKDLISAIVLAL